MTESRLDSAQGVADPTADPAVDLGDLAQVVQACPAVAGLHPGTSGAITTQTGHGRLAGLLLVNHILLAGVVGFRPHSTAVITEQVRDAVAARADGLYVVVTVIATTPESTGPHPRHRAHARRDVAGA